MLVIARDHHVFVGLSLFFPGLKIEHKWIEAESPETYSCPNSTVTTLGSKKQTANLNWFKKCQPQLVQKTDDHQLRLAVYLTADDS